MSKHYWRRDIFPLYKYNRKKGREESDKNWDSIFEVLNQIRDELKELACLGFSSDLVMQSFCHTAAYPKPVDEVTHRTLPDFFINRGGVSLRPGDGIIHSWLNRMLLPDTVGTGGDSHTRFPIGISFPAGSGMVAFAATLGVMPLEMPESVLVRF